jgi:hypothetical protein
VVVERLHGARSGDFSKMISGVFKPYMPLYLKLERAHMADLIKKVIQEETWGARHHVGAEEGEDDDDEQQASVCVCECVCVCVCVCVCTYMCALCMHIPPRKRGFMYVCMPRHTTIL